VNWKDTLARQMAKLKKKERRASSADGAGEDKWKSPENHAGAPVTRRTGMRLYFDSSHVHSYNTR